MIAVHSLTHEGAYAGPLGATFGCGLGSWPTGDFVAAGPHLWRLQFSPEPPVSGDFIALDIVYERPSRVVSVILTANGQIWRGTVPDELFGASVRQAPDGREGVFSADGLRPDTGGPERIAVRVRWRCQRPAV